jgi:hypothetical protein
MAQTVQNPCSEVARAASFHANQTGLKLGEEPDQLAPTQRAAHDNLSGFINSVDLKNVLGQIKVDSANLHNGCSFCSWSSMETTLWHN